MLAAVEPARVCVVVKADGYGHGAVPVARAALDAGADWLAVALVEEGVQLRDAGIDADVLVLAPAPGTSLTTAIERRLTLTADSARSIEEASRATAADAGVLQMHLKVDTGMHRVGVTPGEAVELARRIIATPGLSLGGTWTHFARADEPTLATTGDQLARFSAVVAELRRSGIDPGIVHAANSAGALTNSDARLDMVRCGITAWGLAPGPGQEPAAGLRPALRLVSAISALRRIGAGEGVSYGHRWTASRETTIGTVPVGYADGIRRDSSSHGVEVLVGDRPRPIVGAVTMDQLMIDLGDDDVGRGDEVVLIGRQGECEVTAWDWAERLDTIAYEVLCAISGRVPRVHMP